MRRPGTAHPRKIPQIFTQRYPKLKLNQSSNKIAPAFREQPKEENAEQVRQQVNQIRSENPLGPTKEMSKKDLANMLMKFQLNKMGFTLKQYLPVMDSFIKNADLTQVKFSNVKQWVLVKRNEIVQILLKPKQEKLSEEQKSEVQQNKVVEAAPLQIKPVRLVNIRSEIELSVSSVEYQRPKIELKVAEQLPKIQTKREITAAMKIMCPICLISTAEYIKRECGHIFCKECIKSYFVQNIRSGNYILDCPEYECNQKMTEQEAAVVLNEAQYNRFVRFSRKIKLESDSNNKFCTRPDCGQLLVETNDQKLFCKTCNIAFCDKCQEPAHIGQQCGQLLQQEIHKMFKNFKIKKCPKCSSPIQKIDGCNHMTCKKCKEQFCWICLGEYTPYHYRIYNCCGCPGLMYDDADQVGFKRFIQVVFFVLLPVIIGLSIAAILLMLPLFMVFDFLSKPFKWISDFDSYDPCCQIIVLKNVCCFLPDCLIMFFSFLILYIRSALYCVFVSPIQYSIIVINIICNVV